MLDLKQPSIPPLQVQTETLQWVIFMGTNVKEKGLSSTRLELKTFQFKTNALPTELKV